MSMSEMFVKELLNSFKFSLPEIFKITRPKIMIKAKGIVVIIFLAHWNGRCFTRSSSI
jgi:hypothetical protein